MTDRSEDGLSELSKAALADFRKAMQEEVIPAIVAGQIANANRVVESRFWLILNRGDTEAAMYRAWRKRAEEAELAPSPLREPSETPEAWKLLDEIEQYARTSYAEGAMIDKRGDSRLQTIVNKIRVARRSALPVDTPPQTRERLMRDAAATIRVLVKGAVAIATLDGAKVPNYVQADVNRCSVLANDLEAAALQSPPVDTGDRDPKALVARVAASDDARDAGALDLDSEKL